MTTDANKQVIRRLYEDCINPGQLDLVGPLVSDDYVGPRGERGPSGFTATLTSLRTGFPDIHFTIDDLIAEADKVTIRWTGHATHGGTFVGPYGTFPATGKRLTNTGIAIYQFTDHKIVRTWLESDRLGALQQIGALPGPAPAPSPARETASPQHP